jgi:hypothetical protein
MGNLVVIIAAFGFGTSKSDIMSDYALNIVSEI